MLSFPAGEQSHMKQTTEIHCKTHRKISIINHRISWMKGNWNLSFLALESFGSSWLLCWKSINYVKRSWAKCVGQSGVLWAVPRGQISNRATCWLGDVQWPAGFFFHAIKLRNYHNWWVFNAMSWLPWAPNHPFLVVVPRRSTKQWRFNPKIKQGV